MTNPEEPQVIEKVALDKLREFMKDNGVRPIYSDRVLPDPVFSPLGFVMPLPKDEYNPYLHDLVISVGGVPLISGIDYQITGDTNNNRTIVFSTPINKSFDPMEKFFLRERSRSSDCLWLTNYFSTMKEYYYLHGKKDWKLNWKETNARKPKKKPSSLLLGLVKKL